MAVAIGARRYWYFGGPYPHLLQNPVANNNSRSIFNITKMLRKFDIRASLLKRSLWLILPIARHYYGGKQARSTALYKISWYRSQAIQGPVSESKWMYKCCWRKDSGDPLIGSRTERCRPERSGKSRQTVNKLIKKCQVFRWPQGQYSSWSRAGKTVARAGSTLLIMGNMEYIGILYQPRGVFSSVESYSARTLLVSGPYFKNEPQKAEVRKGRSGFGVITVFWTQDPVLESTGYANECG